MRVFLNRKPSHALALEDAAFALLLLQAVRFIAEGGLTIPDVVMLDYQLEGQEVSLSEVCSRPNPVAHVHACVLHAYVSHSLAARVSGRSLRAR